MPTRHNSLERQPMGIVACALRGMKRSSLGDDADHGYCSPRKNHVVVEMSAEDRGDDTVKVWS